MSSTRPHSHSSKKYADIFVSSRGPSPTAAAGKKRKGAADTSEAVVGTTQAIDEREETPSHGVVEPPAEGENSFPTSLSSLSSPSPGFPSFFSPHAIAPPLLSPLDLALKASPSSSVSSTSFSYPPEPSPGMSLALPGSPFPSAPTAEWSMMVEPALSPYLLHQCTKDELISRVLQLQTTIAALSQSHVQEEERRVRDAAALKPSTDRQPSTSNEEEEEKKEGEGEKNRRRTAVTPPPVDTASGGSRRSASVHSQHLGATQRPYHSPRGSGHRSRGGGGGSRRSGYEEDSFRKENGTRSLSSLSSFGMEEEEEEEALLQWRTQQEEKDEAEVATMPNRVQCATSDDPLAARPLDGVAVTTGEGTALKRQRTNTYLPCSSRYVKPYSPVSAAVAEAAAAAAASGETLLLPSSHISMPKEEEEEANDDDLLHSRPAAASTCTLPTPLTDGSCDTSEAPWTTPSTIENPPPSSSAPLALTTHTPPSPHKGPPRASYPGGYPAYSSAYHYPSYYYSAPPPPFPRQYHISLSVMVIDNGSVFVLPISSVLDKSGTKKRDAQVVEAEWLKQTREADTPVVASRFLNDPTTHSLERFSLDSVVLSLPPSCTSATGGDGDERAHGGGHPQAEVHHEHLHSIDSSRHPSGECGHRRSTMTPHENEEEEEEEYAAARRLQEGMHHLSCGTSAPENSTTRRGVPWWTPGEEEEAEKVRMENEPMASLTEDLFETDSEENPMQGRLSTSLQHPPILAVLDDDVRRKEEDPHTNENENEEEEASHQMHSRKARRHPSSPEDWDGARSSASSSSSSIVGGGRAGGREEEEEPSPKRPSYYAEASVHEAYAVALRRGAGLPPHLWYGTDGVGGGSGGDPLARGPAPSSASPPQDGSSLAGPPQRPSSSSASPPPHPLPNAFSPLAALRDISLDSDALISVNTLRNFYHRLFFSASTSPGGGGGGPPPSSFSPKPQSSFLPYSNRLARPPFYGAFPGGGVEGGGHDRRAVEEANSPPLGWWGGDRSARPLEASGEVDAGVERERRRWGAAAAAYSGGGPPPPPRAPCCTSASTPESSFGTAIYYYLVKTFTLTNGFCHSPRDVEGFGRTLLALCGDTQRVLQGEPRHGYLSSPCYVFGDIHGNFKDLFYFMDNLISFQDLRYTPHKFLFLGDYVDRGDFSVEVIAYLFSMKVLAPEKLILLRGNHEDSLVSGDVSGYGKTSFRAQCHSLFGVTLGEEVWGRVSQVFMYLPLSANIDGTIFCVHGGIPRWSGEAEEEETEQRGGGGGGRRRSRRRTAAPQEIASSTHGDRLDNEADPTKAPKNPKKDGREDHHHSTQEEEEEEMVEEEEAAADYRLEDLMRDDFPLLKSFFEVPEGETKEHERLRRLGMDTCWADPADDESMLDAHGFGDNPRGPGVILFGSKAVDTFLTRYGFQYLFRAHQEKADGLKLCKNARVFTIFSSSGYVGHRNGAGVVLVADGVIRLIIKNADPEENDEEIEEYEEEEEEEEVEVEPMEVEEVEDEEEEEDMRMVGGYERDARRPRVASAAPLASTTSFTASYPVRSTALAASSSSATRVKGEGQPQVEDMEVEKRGGAGRPSREGRRTVEETNTEEKKGGNTMDASASKPVEEGVKSVRYAGEENDKPHVTRVCMGAQNPNQSYALRSASSSVVGMTMTSTSTASSMSNLKAPPSCRSSRHRSGVGSSRSSTSLSSFTIHQDPLQVSPRRDRHR